MWYMCMVLGLLYSWCGDTAWRLVLTSIRHRSGKYTGQVLGRKFYSIVASSRSEKAATVLLRRVVLDSASMCVRF